jgi:hypothetical protein
VLEQNKLFNQKSIEDITDIVNKEIKIYEQDIENNLI